MREVLPSGIDPDLGRSFPGVPGYFDPEQVERRIQALDDIAPEYPAAARLARKGGRVVLQVLVDDSGAVRGISPVVSNRLFDRAAVETLRPVRFTPAMRLGRPVPSRLLVELDYSLDPEGQIAAR